MSGSTSTKNLVKASMEAIAYQGQSGLFRELTAAFQQCIDRNIKDQKEFMALNMGEIVARHTGMAIQFKLDPQVGLINACAMPVILDANSPFLQAYKELGYGAYTDSWTTTHEKILPLCRSLRGSIDRGRSRVTGVFTKLPTDILMGSGLWLTLRLNAEEIAAICIHEIGHVFTYFESLLQATTTNITLACAKRDINKMPSKEERLQLVFEMAEFMQVKLDNAEKLADPTTRPEVFCSIFLAAAGSRVRSSAGANQYDLRSSEVVADQFAARHGAGRATATGLHKMNAAFDPTLTAPIWLHYITEVIKLSVMAIGLAAGAAAAPVAAVAMLGLVGLAVMGYLANPFVEFKIYDDPKERLDRIRKDLIQSLKTVRFDAKQRAVLVRDIDEIAELVNTIHGARTLMNMLWIYVGPNRRAQFKQMRFEQELEKLVNNDIFVKAAKLQTLYS